jgi:hypothetical protein
LLAVVLAYYAYNYVIEGFTTPAPKDIFMKNLTNA